MEFACDLISLEPGPGRASPRLTHELGMDVKVNFGSGERTIRLGDYLGNQLAMTLSSPYGVPAASIVCWDEGGEFGNFREAPPGLWLASRLGSVIAGDWKAEGYGFTLRKQGVRIARWAVWDEPAEAEAAHATYDAISPVVLHSEGKTKDTDLLLVQNLICRDPESSSAAAFVAAIHDSRESALVLAAAVKEAVGAHLVACSS
jgi:hypothetical protein